MQNTRLKVLLLTQYFLVISSALSAGNVSEKIARIVKAQADSGYIHGVVMVAENGEIVYSDAYGLASIEWNIPNSPDTRFRIYSMSKQFTALLVMQLVRDGKIDLQKHISEYLPFYPREVREQVTVHQLLTHTHGIEEGYDRLPPFLITDPTRQMIEKYFSNPLEFEPGSRFRYSGLLGYFVLATHIEWDYFQFTLL